MLIFSHSDSNSTGKTHRRTQKVDKEEDARDAQQQKTTMMNHKTEDDDNHMEASAEQEQVSHTRCKHENALVETSELDC